MDVAIIAALLGSGICMGLGSLSNGAGIGYVVTGALRGWIRQPNLSASTFRMMLIGQAGASTPSIFALVISLVLLIKMGNPASVPAPQSWALAAAFLGAGLCLGLGAVGSGFGCGVVGSEAVEASARTPRQSGQIMLYMLVGQAWSQTPNIFALVIGMMLMLSSQENTVFPENISHAARLLGTGISMGAGAIGPAVGIGFVGGKFCRAMADDPKHTNTLLRNTYILGAAVSESTTVYAFVISLLLFYY
ncbi:MAG: ATP synthase F0 subunit C [Planctomycetota bacterium]|jgi:ATP synthase F0 subunit c